MEYESTDASAKALTMFNMQNFEGRRLTVQYSLPRGPRQASGNSTTQYGMNAPTKTLFIGNMSFDMSDRDLNLLFREIKNVVDVRVAIDRRTGQPRGFAHADFVDVGSAEAAMADLKNKVVHGRALRVDFSTSAGRSAMAAAPVE